MSLCSPWDLKLLHHLILRLKEAKYDLKLRYWYVLFPSQGAFYRGKGLFEFLSMKSKQGDAHSLRS